MKNSGMLDLLALTDRDLAIHGADGDDDGKSGGDDKDKDDTGKDGADKSEKQDGQDKDKKSESVTLTGRDFWTWNNLQEERDRIHGEKLEMAEKVKVAEAARDEAIANATDDDSKKQLTGLTAERDALLVTNADLQMQLAFVTTPGYDWVDAEAALKLADLSKVDTDKKGKVIPTSLKVELDRLAKEKPYLLKPKSEDDDDADKKDKDTRRKSGDPAPQDKRQNKSKDQDARDAEMRRKYPALRR